jgi:hypothetical protein
MRSQLPWNSLLMTFSCLERLRCCVFDWGVFFKAWDSVDFGLLCLALVVVPEMSALWIRAASEQVMHSGVVVVCAWCDEQVF